MSDSPLTISVALCTYNGATYLGEQLASIAAQTRLPMELVVVDDGSTDDTWSIIEDFATSAPFSVRSFRNERNLGVAGNFGKAVELCEGDLIALSDQDDVWRSDKLDVTAQAFEHDPDLVLAFSDADLVNVDLKPLGKRLSDTGNIDAGVQRIRRTPEAGSGRLRRNVATGATMAFRRSLRDLVLPVPDDLLTYHDAWIVQLAAVASKVAFIPEPLMQYRQHPGQHTWDFVYVHGAKRVLDKSYYAAHLRQLVEMRNRLVSKGSDCGEALELLDGYIEHLRRRSSMPARRWRRIGPVLAEIMSGRYHRYSSGWRSAARDVMAPSI